MAEISDSSERPSERVEVFKELFDLVQAAIQLDPWDTVSVSRVCRPQGLSLLRSHVRFPADYEYVLPDGPRVGEKEKIVHVVEFSVDQDGNFLKISSPTQWPFGDPKTGATVPFHLGLDHDSLAYKGLMGLKLMPGEKRRLEEGIRNGFHAEQITLTLSGKDVTISTRGAHCQFDYHISNMDCYKGKPTLMDHPLAKPVSDSLDEQLFEAAVDLIIKTIRTEPRTFNQEELRIRQDFLFQYMLKNPDRFARYQVSSRVRSILERVKLRH